MVDSTPRGSSGDGAVDRARLTALRDEVGDDTLRRYAAAYLELLPDRLDRIERAMAAGGHDSGEHADAARVVLDLQVAGAMLGAGRFAALLGVLEWSPTAGPANTGAAAMAAVRAEADAVVLALRGAAGG